MNHEGMDWAWMMKPAKRIIKAMAEGAAALATAKVGEVEATNRQKEFMASVKNKVMSRKKK